MFKAQVAQSGKIRTIKKCETYKQAYYACTEAILREDEALHYSYSMKYLMNGYSTQKLFPYGSTKGHIGNKTFLIKEV